MDGSSASTSCNDNGNKTPKKQSLKLSIPARHPSGFTNGAFPLPLPPQQASASSNPSHKTTGSIEWGSAEIRDVSLDDLEASELLGRGNSGKVFKVRHKRNGNIYALKVIQEQHDPTIRKNLVKEIEICRRFCSNSPNVVQCYGVFERGGEISLVLEYMDGGTLAQVLNVQRTLPEHYLAELTRQVLKGLMYLHSNKVVHRDIKPSNLLINCRQQVKIGDFGVSTELAHTLAQCNSFVGTCAYMSPERFNPDGNGGFYDCSADIWSFGLTLLECAVGYFPCLSPDRKPDWPTLMYAICMRDPPAPPADASPEFQSFIHHCLQKEPAKRPTALWLLDHPFARKFEGQSCSLLPLLERLRS